MPQAVIRVDAQSVRAKGWRGRLRGDKGRGTTGSMAGEDGEEWGRYPGSCTKEEPDRLNADRSAAEQRPSASCGSPVRRADDHRRRDHGSNFAVEEAPSWRSVAGGIGPRPRVETRTEGAGDDGGEGHKRQVATPVEGALRSCWRGELTAQAQHRDVVKALDRQPLARRRGAGWRDEARGAMDVVIEPSAVSWRPTTATRTAWAPWWRTAAKVGTDPKTSGKPPQRADRARASGTHDLEPRWRARVTGRRGRDLATGRRSDAVTRAPERDGSHDQR